MCVFNGGGGSVTAFAASNFFFRRCKYLQPPKGKAALLVQPQMIAGFVTATKPASVFATAKIVRSFCLMSLDAKEHIRGNL